MPPFKGCQTLSWHLINELVAKDFDLVTCQEMLVDHAFTVPVKLFWSDDNRTLLTVPIWINTVQFPLPSAKSGFPVIGPKRLLTVGCSLWGFQA